MKILVDEMYEGLIPDLKKAGYIVESVKQLINQGKPLRSDFSVLSYAKSNDHISIIAESK